MLFKSQKNYEKCANLIGICLFSKVRRMSSLKTNLDTYTWIILLEKIIARLDCISLRIDLSTARDNSSLTYPYFGSINIHLICMNHTYIHVMYITFNV